jgi:hypothetical protein
MHSNKIINQENYIMNDNGNDDYGAYKGVSGTAASAQESSSNHMREGTPQHMDSAHIKQDGNPIAASSDNHTVNASHTNVHNGHKEANISSEE